MDAVPVTVVWAYRRTGKFALHVLTGALETDPGLAAVPLVFASGPAAIAAAARAALQQGHRVLVGWSFFSPDAERMAAELAQVREALPDDPRLLHVAGGVHASAEPLATLRQGFDLVAAGEGEQLTRDLVAALRRGGDPRAVAGIAWQRDGQLERAGRAARVELDAFPPFAPGHCRYGPIEITRGCIYACRFCQTPHFAGASFRHRSVANVAGWARLLVGRGFRDFRFLTPTALSYGSSTETPDLGAVEALLAAVRAEIGPARRLYFGTFPSEVRPEHVTAGALVLLRRLCDNRTLIIGGQSGSEAMLQQSRRGHGAAVVEQAAARAIEHGFQPHVDFLFGLPGEDDADVAASIELMQRLVARGARVHGHTFLPLPGTPWRGAAAGTLAPALRARLGGLAAAGSAYGQWGPQERTARQLAARRAVP